MTGLSRNATDKGRTAWLNAGPVDRGVGDGLTFFAKASSVRERKASWILRYRYGGRQREKVIGRSLTFRSRTPETSPARTARCSNKAWTLVPSSGRRSPRLSTCITSKAWLRSGTSATSTANTSTRKSSSERQRQARRRRQCHPQEPHAVSSPRAAVRAETTTPLTRRRVAFGDRTPQVAPCTRDERHLAVEPAHDRGPLLYASPSGVS
jgi:hypothetical protein